MIPGGMSTERTPRHGGQGVGMSPNVEGGGPCF